MCTNEITVRCVNEAANLWKFITSLTIKVALKMRFERYARTKIRKT